MATQGIDHFIEKLANSGNPLLAGLGTELQGLSAQSPVSTGAPSHLGVAADQSVDKNFSVDSELAQGTETDTKQVDEIDQLLTKQMPELSVENKDSTTDNQNRFATQKVATYRDALLARLGKT